MEGAPPGARAAPRVANRRRASRRGGVQGTGPVRGSVPLNHASDGRARSVRAFFVTTAKVAVEQDVAAHPEYPVGGTMTVAERGRRGKPDAGAAVANEQRREGKVQAIERVRLKEHR